MNKLKLMLGVAGAFALTAGFSSCSDDDDNWGNQGAIVDLPANHRAFFLYEGSWKANNSGIMFYDTNGKAESIADIFFAQNSTRLGDTAQDIIADDGKMYVAVNGSNYLARLSASAVEEARVSFATDPDLQGGIRYIVEDDGYIYATFYGGVVAKIDANTLQVNAKLTGLGGNLEGIAESDGKLYVANSCSSTWEYYKDLHVIDVRSFTKERTVEVPQNPRYVLEDDDKVFVISYDYSSADGYVLSMVEPRNNYRVTRLGNASVMNEYRDRLYLVNSVSDNGKTNTTFYTYDIKSGTISNASFLQDAPQKLLTSTVYMLAINDGNGDIYIGTTDYVANGTIYRFDRRGRYVTKFEAGGINPSKGVFFN